MADEQVLEQLYSLRDLTRRTGTVCDVQLMHLRRWAMLVFDGGETVTKVLVEEKEVRFQVTPKSRKSVTSYGKKEAVANLVQWTKTLLGEDWGVLIDLKAKKGRGQIHKHPGKKLQDPMWDMVRRIEREKRSPFSNRERHD